MCLRLQGDHYTVTGRDPEWQKRIIEEILAEHVWGYEVGESGLENLDRRSAKWRFRDPDAVIAHRAECFILTVPATATYTIARAVVRVSRISTKRKCVYICSYRLRFIESWSTNT
jgi:hypothetical protein